MDYHRRLNRLNRFSVENTKEVRQNKMKPTKEIKIIVDNGKPYEENLKGIDELKAKLKFEEQLEKIAKTPTAVSLEKFYLVPKEYIKMVIQSRARGFLLYGEAGLGKSFNVKKGLKEANLEEGKDFVFIAGHITPLQLYKKLYYNKDKLIILDDINLFESKINLNMFKACLSDNANLVEYSSSALRDIPNQFVFSGRVIILLNEKPENSEHLKAVEDRILHYHLEMGYDTKIQVLYDVAKVDYDGVTLKERQYIAKWIKDNTNQATKNLSIRLLFTCFEFYKWNKAIWTTLAANYLKNDEYLNLIIKGTPECDWTRLTGMHRATYYRYKQKLQPCATCDINATENATSQFAGISGN